MSDALTPVPPPSNWTCWTRHTPNTSASETTFVSKLDGVLPGPHPNKALPSTPATQVCTLPAFLRA